MPSQAARLRDSLWILLLRRCRNIFRPAILENLLGAITFFAVLRMHRHEDVAAVLDLPFIRLRTRLPSEEYARMKIELVAAAIITVDDDNSADRLAELPTSPF
jgi:hypothetical protein